MFLRVASYLIRFNKHRFISLSNKKQRREFNYMYKNKAKYTKTQTGINC